MEREVLRVEVTTAAGVYHGDLIGPKGMRLLDVLNTREGFIALIRAVHASWPDRPIPFVAINKLHILTVGPLS